MADSSSLMSPPHRAYITMVRSNGYTTSGTKSLFCTSQVSLKSLSSSLGQVPSQDQQVSSRVQVLLLNVSSPFNKRVILFTQIMDASNKCIYLSQYYKHFRSMTSELRQPCQKYITGRFLFLTITEKISVGFKTEMLNVKLNVASKKIHFLL